MDCLHLMQPAYRDSEIEVNGNSRKRWETDLSDRFLSSRHTAALNEDMTKQITARVIGDKRNSSVKLCQLY